jgi:hypothetical protein
MSQRCHTRTSHDSNVQRDFSELSKLPRITRHLLGRGTEAGSRPKMTDNPMRPPETRQVSQAARCGAKTRSGAPCKSAPVTGRRRCRMHGGADGSGAPKGPKNGNYQHGRYTLSATCKVAASRNVWRPDRRRLIYKPRRGSQLSPAPSQVLALPCCRRGVPKQNLS